MTALRRHVFLGDKTANNCQKYHEAKKAAKKAVALTKATHYNYRKARVARCINDENGHLLTERKKALKRWCDYFEGISTELLSMFRPQITVKETDAALRMMRPGKATGPDDLPADLWKSKFWYSVEWLVKFFNQVVAEKKVPDVRQESTTIPVWKKKDSPTDCSNYRPIRLLSHSMKIFERIHDSRIREIVKLSSNQCGFVAGNLAVYRLRIEGRINIICIAIQQLSMKGVVDLVTSVLD
ncbi:unnamed protein product [Heligmosomoides polygyrus]|uniref:Reverse transcriptase domain-containing protein n=1 Tax=Heligmosomoides polygyrus TaxID=6339 RepID=A0A183FX25_HELPZ|nr:unnamed protein product [Heligmosomoides polygyrus]